MLFFLSLAGAFIFMEFTAWFVHKYIMHGLLWEIHKDHHQPSGGIFEKNDLFFLVFAIPSWLAIMFGLMYKIDYLTGTGFGIAAYGLVYFLVHDVLIHRRTKWFDKINTPYFRAVRKAHKIHHKNRSKKEGTCFGMLTFPLKYYRETRRRY